MYEKVAEHFHRQQPQRVSLAKVDATANPGLAEPFELKGYPTLVLLRGGQRIADFNGPRTFEGLVEFVERELQQPPGAPHAPTTKEPLRTKTGTKAKLLSKLERRIQWAKQTARALLTEHDPLTGGLVMLACMIAIGACLMLMLFLCTGQTDRADGRGA